EALRASYPIIDRLVGERFFDHAAARYIRDYPPGSGNLHDFGGQFAELLAACPGASLLSYLADVARLEWACQEVYHAAEPARLKLAALAEVPPDRYHELRFQLNPAGRLLASDYPILRIWQVHQPEYQGETTVDLSLGGIQLLVIRRALEIEFEPLSQGEYALLKALREGRTLGDACGLALEAEPHLNVAALLRSHVARHTLVGFSL
ncbi:MAG: HvfC/BufC family peptide modification chaperone, partial [Gammaproteobacteria bacterium]